EIEGFAITEALIESRRMIVNMDAFDHKDGFKMFNGRMLYFHNQDKEPVGEVVEYKLIKKKGLWIRARLWRENSELFKRAILEKKLQAMSIGFAIDKWEYDEKEDIVTITEARLKEISVVNIGADENALFEVLNSLNNVGLTTNFNEGDNTLSTKKPFDAEVFMSEQEKLGAKVESLQEILTGVKEAQTQANEKLISKSELAERLETFTSALDAIKADIDAVKTQKATSEHRLAYKDYRSLITDFIWLTDDDGNKLGNIAQRAYCLFQMPVDYDNMDNGFELKNLRDLHDATLLADAMSRFKGRDRYSIQNLKLYKQLITATEAFDKDVALAMAG
ncbi:MAG: HK97 family phage prohead protease, partial [Candidatus Heimdallarchaeota archaeon]|nr:HK97 family phage prohead protease [Candidatus Heimdallarchaeota archaeon]